MRPVSVLSFNMDMYEPELTALSELFRGLEIDVGGLQEATEINLACIQRQDIEFVRGDVMYGEDGKPDSWNVIVFNKRRFECTESATLWLTEDGRRGKGWDSIAQRTAVIAVMRERETGRELVYANAHLDNKSEMARLQSTRLLLRYLREHSLPRAQILAGDLNFSAGPGVAEQCPFWIPRRQLPYRLITESAGFRDCWVEMIPSRPRGRTFHNRQGHTAVNDAYDTLCPDHVLARHMRTLRMNTIVQQSYGRYASDHYPLYGSVDWE